MEVSRIQRIIRGLHAATLVCFSLNQHTLESIPDFSLWSWDYNPPDKGLDKELSAFLQSLFPAFYTTLKRIDNPITALSLIVDCLNLFNGQPEWSTPKLDGALCFFVAVMERSNPEVFKRGPLLKRTAGRRPDGSFTCQITRGNAYATTLSST
jgi:hypothetical protein